MTDEGPALLVVDDNEDNRYTLTRRLKREGYTNLTTANDGREALDALAKQPFDLVLLDIMMPVMNGYEVLEHINGEYVRAMSADDFMEATLDVWKISPESAKRVQHPAPFPVELPRRLIDLYTYEGDVVLDPFLGSGSTLVAAERTGRRGRALELEPRYVDVTLQRYWQITGEEPVHAETGLTSSDQRIWREIEGHEPLSHPKQEERITSNV